VGADQHRFDAFLHDGGHGAGDHEGRVLDVQCVLDRNSPGALAGLVVSTYSTQLISPVSA
jgi:hypothetical protein